MIASSDYQTGLDKNPANYEPLTPLTFLQRAAEVYPQRVATIHGSERRTWEQTYTRCRQLASALRRRGVGPGSTVAVVAPNTPQMFELHFAVPMTGAVLNTINTRLDPPTIAYVLAHAQAGVLFADKEFGDPVASALSQVEARLLVVGIDDPAFDGGRLIGDLSYDQLLSEGDADFTWHRPDDEWEAISLNYTSGTTGKPKGVVYHHRGAYLNAVSNIMVWEMPLHPVYLWTLPMFHCNGWCFPWTIAATVGVSVSLRQVRAERVFELIRDQGVTHFCGAPIVLNLLVNAPQGVRSDLQREVKVMTAGAPPPSTVIEGMERMGFRITHVYGLTETYGPAVVCAWHPEWEALDASSKATRKARQGVRYPMLEGLMVADPESLDPVPKDGETMGEILMRGNIVMKGYLKNPDATREAFRGGWFHSGDLAVWHPDGYVEIKDRSKDIIISGGENISSIEIENTLYRHPEVLEAAVVAMPDEKWGETPCAFVALKDGASAGEREIIEFCRDQMARFKAPGRVVFGPLPKTSTGKIQKYLLRDLARSEKKA